MVRGEAGRKGPSEEEAREQRRGSCGVWEPRDCLREKELGQRDREEDPRQGPSWTYLRSGEKASLAGAAVRR